MLAGVEGVGAGEGAEHAAPIITASRGIAHRRAHMPHLIFLGGMVAEHSMKDVIESRLRPFVERIWNYHRLDHALVRRAEWPAAGTIMAPAAATQFERTTADALR